MKIIKQEGKGKMEV